MVRFGSSSRTRAFIARKGTFSEFPPTPYTGHGTAPTKTLPSPKPMRQDLSAAVLARMQSHYLTTGRLLKFVVPASTGTDLSARVHPMPGISAGSFANGKRLSPHYCVCRGHRGLFRNRSGACTGFAPYQLWNDHLVRTPAGLGSKGCRFVLQGRSERRAG